MSQIRKLQLAIIVIAIILTTASNIVQARNTDNMFGSWNSVTLSGNFADKSVKTPVWRWLVVEQGVWRDDSPKGLRMFDNNLFGQVGYNMGQHSSIWLGYLHNWIHPLGKAAFQENRPYQDYLWAHPVWSGRLLIRTRLEQRVHQDTGNIGVRVRETLQVNYPLPTINGLGVYVSGDFFAYLNKNDFAPTGFNEARAAAGLTYNFNPHLDVDLGYLGVFIETNGKNGILSHNLQVNLRYTFN